MAQSLRFKSGDAVVHSRRREWGDGVVEQATDIRHEGNAAQRLTVRFTQRGRVTLNTAVAQLAVKTMERQMSKSQTTSSSEATRTGGWLGSLEKEQRPHELWVLPEALSDPFTSLKQRVAATLETFRFSTDPRSLIDWAVAQTGKVDPLTTYTRHELEQGFARFCRDRDLHLKDLVRHVRQQGEVDMLRELRNTTRYPQAMAVLDRVMRS
jgi:hypothetical protein